MAVPWLLVSCLLAGVLYLVEGDDDQDYVDQCLPQLADRCFKDVFPSLVCHIENKGECDNVNNFCSVVADSLQCAVDIIDTDCKASEGRVNFDSWMRGLQAVHQDMCGTSKQLLRVFLDSPCFNSEEFLECVDDMTKVTHVVDLLHVVLNANECRQVLIAIPTCNVRASAAHSTCFASQEVINRIIYTFFSQTDCGVSCPPASQAASLSTHTHYPLSSDLLLPAALVSYIQQMVR